VKFLSRKFQCLLFSHWQHQWGNLIIASFVSVRVFRVEPVRVLLPDGTSKITPDLSPRLTTARASYVNACTGLNLKPTEVATLLERMTLSAQVSPTDPDTILVQVPATRPDIFHECAAREDLSILFCQAFKK